MCKGLSRIARFFLVGDECMTKNRKMRLRIIISLVLFVILFVCEHMGSIRATAVVGTAVDIFAVPYLIVGYDIIF